MHLPSTALRARRVAIDTYRENVVYLRRDCPVYQAEGFQALSKVEVKANGAAILAVLNVVDDERIVGELELGLSEEAFAQMQARDGTLVTIAHAEPPQSIASLKRKISGERLSRDEYSAMVRDIAGHRYSKIELAAFVVALSQMDLDRDEVFHLAKAMVDAGRRLDWHEQPVVDKHCIGGIPGNRTSILVVPIVAAHGMLMPKTSSRAITSPSGTADTMACLAEVELPFDRMEAIVREHRGCLAWGGTATLSPADDILISVSRPLSLRGAYGANARRGQRDTGGALSGLHAPGLRVHPRRGGQSAARRRAVGGGLRSRGYRRSAFAPDIVAG